MRVPWYRTSPNSSSGWADVTIVPVVDGAYTVVPWLKAGSGTGDNAGIATPVFCETKAGTRADLKAVPSPAIATLATNANANPLKNALFIEKLLASNMDTSVLALTHPRAFGSLKLGASSRDTPPVSLPTTVENRNNGLRLTTQGAGRETRKSSHFLRDDVANRNFGFLPDDRPESNAPNA